MSVDHLCGQLQSVISELQTAYLDAQKRYHIQYDKSFVNSLAQKEQEIRFQIYRSYGFPAYQVCESCEPAISSK